MRGVMWRDWFTVWATSTLPLLKVWMSIQAHPHLQPPCLLLLLCPHPYPPQHPLPVIPPAPSLCHSAPSLAPSPHHHWLIMPQPMPPPAPSMTLRRCSTHGGWTTPPYRTSQDENTKCQCCNTGPLSMYMGHQLHSWPECI